MNVGRFLDISEARFPNKTAILCRGQRYTYREVKGRVQRLMSGLSKMGVQKGDRVATLMRNSSEMMEVNLAAIRLGAVFTPLNYRSKTPEAAYVVNNAQPKVLFTDHACHDIARELSSNVQNPVPTFTTAHKPAGELSSYGALLDENPPFSGALEVSANDACQLLYTSGTTARPKGVVLSHENVTWNALNLMYARRDRAQDISLIVGPLFHAAALNSHYIPRLALGASMIIMDKFDPGEMMAFIQQEGVTVVPGNPTLFIMLLEYCSTRQNDTSSVATLTSGSDKLPDPVKKELLDLFPHAEGIFDIYGLTECGPCVTCLDARDSLRKTACVGPPLPFVQVRLLDDEGREVSTGEEGEIVVRGPSVMEGYYKLPPRPYRTAGSIPEILPGRTMRGFSILWIARRT
jgi:fatty-acyl-CoA synthase